MDNKQLSVSIERVFNASPTVVWQMWTDAEHFKSWYGPNGFSIDVIKMNVVEGGEHMVCMISPDGSKKMFSKGNYKEVIEYQKLVYTDSPCDENGVLISPEAMGMPADFPQTTEVSVQLIDLQGKTKMIMTHIGVPAGAAMGWRQAFDKMVTIIEDVK